MAQLIDDLLHLSRVSQAQLQLREVDLSGQVVTISEDLQRREPQRHSRFLITPGIRATADPQLIGTVLENLLGNAWKFTSRRDEAVIEFGSLPTNDAEVCCFVRDNGAGFDATYRDKLFRPFHRLHTDQEFPGNGIGLASVRRIVERHGGRVWAEGKLDHGATVYFSLDAAATRQPSEPTGPVNALAVRTHPDAPL
jgi:light-regulated signal transduction histidine kinase (bacteriophytochrome)